MPCARASAPCTKPVTAEGIERLLGAAELVALGRYALETCDGTKTVGNLRASSPRPRRASDATCHLRPAAFWRASWERAGYPLSPRVATCR